MILLLSASSGALARERLNGTHAHIILPPCMVVYILSIMKLATQLNLDEQCTCTYPTCVYVHSAHPLYYMYTHTVHYQ